MSRVIKIKMSIVCPEGYEDVHPELILADFWNEPKGFLVEGEIDVIEDSQES